VTKSRSYLSSPHLGGDELGLVQEAFATNWIAPLGPHVDAFEREFSTLTGSAHAAALSSGTAALHLAMRWLKLQPGDEVLCSQLSTFNWATFRRPWQRRSLRDFFVQRQQDHHNFEWQDVGLERQDARGESPVLGDVGPGSGTSL
jgi:dTDP-4-amino-4,6-dideoxygalactose transaminase